MAKHAILGVIEGLVPKGLMEKAFEDCLEIYRATKNTGQNEDVHGLVGSAVIYGFIYGILAGESGVTLDHEARAEVEATFPEIVAAAKLWREQLAQNN